MENIVRNLQAAAPSPIKSQPCDPNPENFSPYRIGVKLLFSILGSGLVVIVGPVAWHTAGSVGLVLIQILLELCRICLFVFQIYGT